MTTAPPGRPITAEEYEQFDPEWRYDLIGGVLVPMPPMGGAVHGLLTAVLATEVSLFVREHRFGVCVAAGTRFKIARNPDTVIAPDWAYIAGDRLPARLPSGFFDLAPDMILEVHSHLDKEKDVLAKIQLWLAAGVKFAWELNPETQVLTVHRTGREPQVLGLDDTLTGEEILPGFALSIRRLFANLNYWSGQADDNPQA